MPLEKTRAASIPNNLAINFFQFVEPEGSHLLKERQGSPTFCSSSARATIPGLVF